MVHSSWHAKRAQVVSVQHGSWVWRFGSQKHGSGRRGLGRGAFSRLVTMDCATFVVVFPPPLLLPSLPLASLPLVPVLW